MIFNDILIIFICYYPLQQLTEASHSGKKKNNLHQDQKRIKSHTKIQAKIGPLFTVSVFKKC